MDVRKRGTGLVLLGGGDPLFERFCWGGFLAQKEPENGKGGMGVHTRRKVRQRLGNGRGRRQKFFQGPSDSRHRECGEEAGIFLNHQRGNGGEVTLGQKRLNSNDNRWPGGNLTTTGVGCKKGEGGKRTKRGWEKRGVL